MAYDGRIFALPPGSWVLDTGGFKGWSRELDYKDFYGRMTGLLGVARGDCINMYGICSPTNMTVPSMTTSG